jgi:NAD-dependent deacetylase
MKNLVFLTGAGMSAESGISTFRDSGGLWEQFKVEDVASIEGYWRNRKLVLDFYNQRRNELQGVKPNAGHYGVADLEKDFNVTVVTQNVDNLHERAGSKHVVHLHGELTKACSERNPNDPRYIRELKAGEEIHIGDKAGDGSQLRPFIVWFGEAVPEIEKAAEECAKADMMIVIGTSLNVYPAAGLTRLVRPDTPIYLIDPKPVAWNSNVPFRHILKGASEGMKELMMKLKIES